MFFSHVLPTPRWLKSLWGKALACTLLTAGLAQAQMPYQTAPAQFSPPPAFIPSDGITAPDFSITDPQVQKAGCTSCGMGNTAASYGPSPTSCVPGRTHCCTSCDYNTCWGRCIGGLYDSLCCPDPCYEPAWIPTANAAFFQDSPRPVTQTRIRWDDGLNDHFPDTAEYFWAQIGTKGPKNPETRVNYNEGTLYQEVAAKGASFFIEVPYLSVDPAQNPSAAGIGDMNLGTKAVLLDRELLLLTFQFKTVLPTGNPSTGIGTGHVSLEPALLGALKLTSSTYLQGELAYWIPISGTSGAAGSVLEYHASLNQSLWNRVDCFNVIGTLEVNGLTYRGSFTDVTGAVVGNGSGSSYLSAGPGLRLAFCNRVDLGLGVGFGFGDDHGPEQIYRTELRVRF